MKTVTFHSYKGGTGKSFLSLNVAAFLAMQNYRVALIDFDTRAPTVYHRFQPHLSPSNNERRHKISRYLAKHSLQFFLFLHSFLL